MPRLIASELKPEERCLKVVQIDTGEELRKVLALDTEEKWVEIWEDNPDHGNQEARAARLAAGVAPVLAGSLFICQYKTRLDADGHAEIAPVRLAIDFDVLHKVTDEALYRVRQP